MTRTTLIGRTQNSHISTPLQINMCANGIELYIVVVRIYEVFRMIFSLTFTEYRTGCKLTDSNLRRVHTTLEAN